MTKTVCGALSNPNGGAFVTTDIGGRSSYGTIEYAPEQAARIPLLIEHVPGLEIGELIYAEKSKRSGVMVVAVLHDDARFDTTGDWYLSASFNATAARRYSADWFTIVAHRGGKLDEISLVRDPADRRISKVVFTSSDVRDQAGGLPHAATTLQRSVLTRAHDHAVAHRRQRQSGLVIVDLDARPAVAPPRAPARAAAAPAPARRSVNGSVTTGANGRVSHRRVGIGEILTVR